MKDRCMEKSLKKILGPKNKNFLGDFDDTDFGDYLDTDDVQRLNFSLRTQDKLVTLRLSSELLSLLKKATVKHKTKYQKLMKLILEKNITRYV